MGDDIGDIEREQTMSEAAEGGQGPPSLSAGRRIPLSPDEQIIVRLWADGYSAEDIARETGRLVATIYQILKRIQKRIVDGNRIDLP